MKRPPRVRLRKRRRYRSDGFAIPLAGEVEVLEARVVLSAAFDVTNLSEARNLPDFAQIDGTDPEGRKIGIAIVDSGILGSHADLKDNFVAFFDAVATDAGADNGITPADTENASEAFDLEGHGTHIAGIAASSNPQIGVAPSAGLIGIRGLPGPDENLPRHDSLLSSLKWIEENHERYNIKVVNLSIQNGTNQNSVPSPNDFARQIEVLESLGIVVVASTGNSYADYAALGASFPAVYASLSVANTWEDDGSGDQLAFLSAGQNPQFVAIDNSPAADQLAASSQRSSLDNQVAAPGSTIFSTWNNGGYNTLAGTSMAAGFVSGLVALVQDAAYTFGGRYLTAMEAAFIIRETAETIFDDQQDDTERARLIPNDDGTLSMGPHEDLAETEQSYRRVNVRAALSRTQSLVNPRGWGDINSFLATAIVFPPLFGWRGFGIRGRIGSDGPNTIGRDDVDVYRVDVRSPGQLRIITKEPSGGDAFDPYVRIFDAGGNEIDAQNDAADGNLYPDLTTGELPPGSYFIGLSSFANTDYDPFGRQPSDGKGGSVGDYELSVTLENPDANGVIQGADLIDLSSPNVASPNSDLAGRGVYRSNGIFGQSIGGDAVADIGQGPVLTEDGYIEPVIPMGTVDVDFFRVIAPDSGRLYIQTDTSNFSGGGVDSFVRVLMRDSSGELVEVGSNDNADGGTTDSFLEVDVVSGETYFIAVSSSGNQDYDPESPFGRDSLTDDMGPYDLYLSFSNGDANGTALGAVNFASWDSDQDGVIVDSIGQDSGEAIWGDQEGREDVDFFLYTATQDGLLDVSLLGEGDDALDGVLGIWELAPDQASIRRFVDAAFDLPRALLEVTAGQSLWVSVTGQGNNGFHWSAVGSGTGGDTGAYRLSIQERPASDLSQLANNSINGHTPSPLELGQLASGNIGLDGRAYLGAADVDLYAYTPTVDQFVVIRTLANQEGAADTYLRIFDADGNELATNNDANDETRGSEVTVLFREGATYYIGVNGNSTDAAGYQPLTGENAAAGSTGSYSLLLTELPPPIYAAGADAGGGPHVRVFDSRTDAELASFFAYDTGFRGGVRVAVGDVTGDGVDDVVTAPGPGGGPHVRVFDGAAREFRSEPKYNFFAFHAGLSTGLNVAVGDVNHDGFEDIIVAPDAVSSPVVRVFSGQDGSLLRSFFAYDLSVSGGVRVASGDVNGDGFDDIITVPGPGSPARVRVFDGRLEQSGLGVDLLQSEGLRIGNLTAYPEFLGGAYAAAGDVNGDGLADVILGAGAGGGPHVMVYSGSNDGPMTLQSYFASAPEFRGGVRVAAAEFRLDGKVEVIAALGPGGEPDVRIFEAETKVVENTVFGHFAGGVFAAGGGGYRLFDAAQELAGTASQQSLAPLSLSDVSFHRDAAITRLAETGLSAVELDGLSNIQFAISDLPGGYLGLAFGNTILLDAFAAGAGWYLDPTPWSDEEFAITPSGELSAIDPNGQGVDLLSVILHELSHHLGHIDLDADLDPSQLLADAIAPGRRRVPEFVPLDAVYADDGLFGDL